LVSESGEKKFLTGGRTRLGIHRLGAARAGRIVLCEGYATGLSIDAALGRLPGAHAVVVCFSARNLELVASRFPGAVVAADNDESLTGELCAERTGLRWIMPPDIGDDFNDMHQRHGLHAVINQLRSAFDT
jgi:putative DNA primase/helicase